MKGLILSPIRLSFQQNPDIPFLFINDGLPGTGSYITDRKGTRMRFNARNLLNDGIENSVVQS